MKALTITSEMVSPNPKIQLAKQRKNFQPLLKKKKTNKPPPTNY